MKHLMPLFTGLADPLRLRILNLLFVSPTLCVCDLELALAEPQAKISRHLAYLRSRKLVSTTRRDQWVHYRISGLAEVDPGFVTALRTMLMASPDSVADIERLLEGLDTNGVVSLQSAPAGTIERVIRICCGEPVA
jgi:ArsR family transcriptional regulator